MYHFQPGQMIGPYRMISQIAQDGMATGQFESEATGEYELRTHL